MSIEKSGRVLFLSKEGLVPGNRVMLATKGNPLSILTEAEVNRLVAEKLADFKGAKLRRMCRILFSGTFPWGIDNLGRVFIFIPAKKGGEDV